MQNAKKYVLTDPRFITPNIREKTVSALDNEISSILNSDAPDDVKAMNYTMTLRRHKNYSEPPAPTPVPPLQKIEPEILESVPLGQKYKAKRLLNRLKKQKEIDVNTSGEIVYRQSTIPDSNITELISDTLNKEGEFDNPPGWEALSAALRAAKTPPDLVHNPARWNFMVGSSRKKADKAKRKAWIHW